MYGADLKSLFSDKPYVWYEKFMVIVDNLVNFIHKSTCGRLIYFLDHELELRYIRTKIISV